MRKSLFFSVFVIVSIITAFSFINPRKSISRVSEKPVSCSVSVTFYNNSTTYTIPAIILSDGIVDDIHYNIAPSSTDVLTIFQTTGSLEFNVQFNSPNPNGKVILLESGNQIACQNITRNSSIVTLQTDNSPTCGASYELKFLPGLTCP